MGVAVRGAGQDALISISVSEQERRDECSRYFKHCPSCGLFLAAIVCYFPPPALLGHSAGPAAALLGM